MRIESVDPDHCSGDSRSKAGTVTVFPEPLEVGGGVPVGLEHSTRIKKSRKSFTTLPELIGAPLFLETPPESITSGQKKGYLSWSILGQRFSMEELLAALPESWLDALRAKRTGLLIDHAREGLKFRAASCEDWHRTLKAYGIEPSRIAYVTQDRGLKSQYEAWCAAAGHAQFMHVFTYDFFVKRFFVDSWAGLDDVDAVISKRKESFLQRDSIEKSYLCLNLKTRPWRVMLLTCLLRDKLWDEGLISFGGLDSGGIFTTAVEDLASHNELSRRFKRSPELKTFLPELAEKGVVYFKRADEGSTWKRARGNRVLDMDSAIFMRTGFSLITETEMAQYKKRVTEKPFKALANCHPLIVFGNFQSLQILRELGFQTFGKWIDESYDEIRKAQKRFDSAYRSFLAFREKANALLLGDSEFRDVIIANLEHSFKGVPALYRNTIDPNLVRGIQQAVPL